MRVQVVRFSSSKHDTLGLLYIDGKFQCFTLEDEKRDTKVWGEMRIPEGAYTLSLYKAGSFHATYSKKFPAIHKGMLYVNNVPGFEAILIHIGNTDKDTAGCLLLGEQVAQNVTGKGSLIGSTIAYTRVYPIIAAALERKEQVIIEYKSIG